MRAFEAAVRLGVPFLETDVRVTSDGVLVAFHDARLDRVTDRRGVVSRLTWQQVRQARIGGVEPIPRLEDVLAAWPEVRVNVDLKSWGAVDPFVSAVRRTGARERVVVASFGDRRRSAAVSRLGVDGAVAWSPGVATIVWAMTSSGWGCFEGRLAAGLRGAGCLQVPVSVGGVRVVTRRLVRAVHAAGAQVHVWTVDDRVVMEELMDLGVDAVVTNRSDLALEVVARRTS
ncbi:MAG: glycerophosphoryl diester phosphodiesterase [Actinomycetota bacterium]|nr:glycerophosphoryl diester phosphodiesterase [Actinomycetota bacterium]